MIYWTVSSTVAPGKREEALQWLKKMAQYGKEHFGTDIEICEPMDGTVGRYIWVEKHESLTAWEEDDKLFEADAGAVALRGEGQGLFTDAKIHFWRTVD